MNKNGNEITITEEESKTCKVCDIRFDTPRKRMWHIKKEHKLDFKEYVIKFYYDGVVPTCLKTRKSLSFKANQLGPWFKNYAKNCFPRNPHSQQTKNKIRDGCEKNSIKKYGVKNVFQSDWCKEKIKNTMIERYGIRNIMENCDIKAKVLSSFFETIRNRPKKIYDVTDYDPNKPSSLEHDLKNKLTDLNIEFESPFIFQGKRYDFYIPIINTVIELDGHAFHKETLEELSLMTLNNSINDYNKNNLIKDTKYNFYRIRYDTNKFIFDENDDLFIKIKQFEYSPSYSIKYKQKIISKEYFSRYIENKGKDKLKSYSKLLLKFIRLFQPRLPRYELEEDIKDVMSKISLQDFSKVYFDGTFHNNISTVGHNYLKYYFESYWKSAYKGNKSPVDCWLDDELMQKIIEYRIGCNNSDEVYDFSLHQMVKGLSANRKTVSFFKPTLAAGIYKHYLKNNSSPFVLDPCCGFGGRLLGFKAVYPNGKYIGCEPNVETYNELIQMVNREKFTDVKIYNCKFEDYNDTKDVDFTFTSIPYFDLESYSNVVNYDDFNHWKNTFIKSIESCHNCYINTSIQLAKELNWNVVDSYIVSNGSHFDKKNGMSTKTELIVKM